MSAEIQTAPKFGGNPSSSSCVILLVLLTNSWCDLPLACTFTDSKGALWSDHAHVSLTKHLMKEITNMASWHSLCFQQHIQESVLRKQH